MSGMREIGEKLGVSVATVSRGLRKHASIKPETQVRIAEAAREMGYEWNPHVGELMSSIRRSRTASFQGTIATVWMGGKSAENSDPRVSLIRKGVQEGLALHGLKTDEFWIDEQRPAALARVLFHRGIEGALLCGPAFFSAESLKGFPFPEFSIVCVGWGLSQIKAHSVRFDYFEGVREAMARTAPVFGSAIAILWSGATDVRANGAAKASFMVNHPAGPAVAEKLYFEIESLNVKQAIAACRRHGVRALLIGSGIPVPSALEEVVPRSGWVEFRAPTTGKVFGWIDTQNILMGLWGVEILSSKLLQRSKGLPDFAQVLLVPPAWRSDESKSVPAKRPARPATTGKKSPTGRA